MSYGYRSVPVGMNDRGEADGFRLEIVADQAEVVREIYARYADFEVQVDGRRAEVVSFRYVDTTDSEDEEERAVASAARRRFLLLFDKSFTDPAGLHRAQDAAADFVRRRTGGAHFNQDVL